MQLKKLLIFGFFVLVCLGKSYAQTPCTALGQNPSTAFPVCGTSAFYQDSVPICSSNIIYVPGCSVYGDTLTAYQNKNPYWYKFTCFQGGTLNFLIVPNDPNEDYDWQLYDITGHNPDEVYTDTSLIITGNWSGAYGPTGANDTGLNYIGCASYPDSLFSTFALSPNLIQGHNYILLISHFSDTQQGYSLSFGGGTAVITDTLPPHLANLVVPSCSPTQMLVKLNKKMKCSSLAANATDFILSPPSATITGAVGMGCTNGFDMDTVMLTFSQPLTAGNYDLIVKTGTDGNTLLDICDTGLPVNESFSFTVLSPLPVPMDSIITTRCSIDFVELFFPRPIQCSSVAVNGSDFFIAGTYPVIIAGAVPVNCMNGLTNRIRVQFSFTMYQPGNFQVILKVGTDGNTILSECDTPSVAGSSVPFTVVPKPVVNFTIPSSVCLPDAFVTFTNRSIIADGSENAFQYLWNFGDPASGANNFSTAGSPTHLYRTAGPFPVKLQVTTNNGCIRDTTILLNTIHPQPKTNFGFNKPAICLGDEITLFDSTNAMDGTTVQWNWDMGDGTIRNTKNVVYNYNHLQTYTISLYTVNSHGCYSDTLLKTITVYPYPAANAGPDRFVLEGGWIIIEATASGNNLQYVWTPATYLNNPYTRNPRSTPTNDITYTLAVTTQEGCTSTDQVFVKVLKIPRIPNTFTPNNDGINDRWEIQYLEDYPDNHLQVFTRAGQLVFESRGYYQKPWDGTIKGKPLPFDTYYYILEPGSGREAVTGYVTIIK